MTEDRHGRIVLLTNDTHNNLIAYDKNGKFFSAWENRFPAGGGNFLLNIGPTAISGVHVPGE